MTTQTMEREIATLTVEQHQENERPTAVHTVEQPEEKKGNFFSRVADMLWRAYFLTPTDFFMPSEWPF